MRPFGVKLLTLMPSPWSNRAKLEPDSKNGPAKMPFSVEGKEFLLTLEWQSVMNNLYRV
jgi:hypothetical protein